MAMTSSSPTQLSPPIRWALMVIGFTSVALGILGIFLPVLPTVPFLLLAAACFTRSSEKFYTWLIDHAHLGPIIRPYLDGKGLRRTTKIKAIALIWCSIALSTYLLRDNALVQGVLMLIASGVTIYLLRLPTLEAEEM